MRYRLLALVAVLGGCGPEVPYVYQEGCATFHSEVELVPWKVAFYYNEAESLFNELLGPAAFCTAMSGVPRIEIQDKPAIDCGFHSCYGITGPFGHITLSQTGSAFFHEMLHVYDLSVVNWSTVDHVGWEENGYLAHEREWKSRVRQYGPWHLTP